MSPNSVYSISEALIALLKEKYGSPLYLFDEASYVENYLSLRNAFRKYYPKYNIAYSYKTNYTPYICKIVLSLGGLAEVVSDFEYYVAKRVGNENSKIIYNGPYKQELLSEHLMKKGIVNIDNLEECERIIEIAKNNPDKSFEVGIRVNIEIGQSFVSRFGVAPKSDDFNRIRYLIKHQENIDLVGIHCHIGQSRTLKHWRRRVECMLDLSDSVFVDKPPRYIDLGSGMYGDMDSELMKQFNDVSNYEEYAEAVAGVFNNHFKSIDDCDKPYLYTEPGATVASRYFWLISTVISHKNIRGKNFTGLDCSYFNAGETCRFKKLPIRIVGKNCDFQGGDFVGYTCLEDDIIYPEYSDFVSIGDTVIFGNTGGYSVVFKPPFILPDIPIVAIKSDSDYELIKKRQSFDEMMIDYVL